MFMVTWNSSPEVGLWYCRNWVISTGIKYSNLPRGQSSRNELNKRVAESADNPLRPIPDTAAVQATVDLWNARTLRGDQPSPLQSVTLPAALAKVTIIPPRYSESGRYTVAVTRDRTGNDLLAHGSATAIGTGDRETVSIDLDLRNSQPGSYFLSTTHEQDQASYYYPLQIK